MQYATFNAAQAELTIQGKNVHPGTAKDTMINACNWRLIFIINCQQIKCRKKTDGAEGFFHLMALNGTVEEAKMAYIIRDHDRETFENRKKQLLTIQEKMNAQFDEARIQMDLYDQYYNMKEIIEKDMSIIELAKSAMEDSGYRASDRTSSRRNRWIEDLYLGIPTPNIFAGGENMHGRYEFVSLESMKKATDVIVKIAEKNAQ